MKSKLTKNIAKILKWYDGDSATISVILGYGISRKIRIRLARIDSPEIQGKSTYEKRRAIKARNILKKICPINSFIFIYSLGRDKYGRYIAEIYNMENENVSDLVLEKFPKLFKIKK